MVNFEYSLSERKKLQIYPLGDVHVGSANFNEKFLEHWKKVFKGTKSDKLIYLQGDLIDLATKRLGNSAFEQTMSADEQIEYILKFLRPFKEHIAGSVTSNHLDRALKEFDLDLTRLMSMELECEYAPSLYHKLEINEKPYLLYATHGTKVSGKTHLMLGTALRSTEHILANLVLYGHCHKGESMSTVFKGVNGYSRKNICLTGHFLNYDGGYAEYQGLKPEPPCFPVISIGNNLQTDIKFIREDEVIYNDC